MLTGIDFWQYCHQLLFRKRIPTRVKRRFHEEHGHIEEVNWFVQDRKYIASYLNKGEWSLDVFNFEGQLQKEYHLEDLRTLSSKVIGGLMPEWAGFQITSIMKDRLGDGLLITLQKGNNYWNLEYDNTGNLINIVDIT